MYLWEAKKSLISIRQGKSYLVKSIVPMGQAPIKCPMCGENEKWRLIDASKKNFSFGKALVGAALIGKVGVLAAFCMERYENRCTIFNGICY